MSERLQEQLDVADKIDIDYLHGIVRYILGKTTSEGKAVMSAADEIERLSADLNESERQTRAQLKRVLQRDERIAKLEADLFASELKAKTFEQGYDESQEARRYLEKALAKGEQANER